MVPERQSCSTEVTRTPHQKQLRQFSATEPLKFLAMDILSLFFKDEIRQSACNGFDRPMHKAIKGNTVHDSTIDERCNRVCWQ